MKVRIAFVGCALLVTYALAQGQVITSQVVTGPMGVKGAPFSADTINTTSRALPDGNQIHQETHGKMYRDSEGRTRTETEIILPFGGKKFTRVTIMDPVQQVFISLDPERKVATVNHMRAPQPSTTVRSTPLGSASASLMQGERLGTRDFDGMTCNGSKMTRTLPAGAIGNEKPIVSVNETWMCPDLKTVVYSKTEDPQMGDHSMKLVNIQRLDPDPLLFQIPPDYTVRDNPPPQ